MTKTSLAVVEEPLREVALPDDLVRDTKRFIVESRAPSTRLKYAQAWQRFECWCAAQNRLSLPASPETIAAWLTAMATGNGYTKPLAISSINQALSAVLLAHRTAGTPIDRQHQLIAETYRGIARSKAREATVRKARPVLGQDLAAMLDGMKDKPIDVRDRALLSIGWAGALRRSELVGLDWMRHGGGQGFVVVDDEAVTITLLASKASQDAAETVVIPRDEMKTASDCLMAWVALARIAPGEPIFRPVDQWSVIGATRLTDASVSRIIKTRVRRYARKSGNTKAAAKELAQAFSGHSLRGGFITTAARNKIPGHRIKPHSRHKSTKVLEGYIAEADKLTDSVLKTIGF